MQRSETDRDTTNETLLDPVDRLSEVMFGLLMALTFTGTMSVTLGAGGTVNGILLAAIGCNIAWGIVDGVMYLLRTATSRRRTRGIVDDIRQAQPTDRPNYVRKLVAEDIAGELSDIELSDVANWLIRKPQNHARRFLHHTDYKAAAAIFLLVVTSTFPPILPFILMDGVFAAMRMSNLIAVVMLFGIGWKLDDYIEHGSMTMRITVPLVGMALVAATIALGG